jgi:hypothetical protein
MQGVARLVGCVQRSGGRAQCVNPFWMLCNISGSSVYRVNAGNAAYVTNVAIKKVTSSSSNGCNGNDSYWRYIQSLIVGSFALNLGLSSSSVSLADSTVNSQSHPDPIPANVRSNELFEDDVLSIDKLPVYSR